MSRYTYIITNIAVCQIGLTLDTSNNVGCYSICKASELYDKKNENF